MKKYLSEITDVNKDFPTIHKWIADGYKLRIIVKKDIAGATKENFEPEEYELALIKEEDWSWYESKTLKECLEKCEEDLIECEKL